MNSMQDLRNVVDDMLRQLAAARDVPADAELSQIIISSLDQMRFLVGLEERLDVMLDVGDVLPFDLSGRDALLKTVQDLLVESGVTL
jgi:acyl carrier protein